MKPLELNDFSGGKTDDILMGDPTRAEIINNLYVSIDKKLSSRKGTIVYPNAPKNTRINSILSFLNGDTLTYSARNSFFDIEGNEIFGPTGLPVFPSGSDFSQITSAESQGHIYVASDDRKRPQKLYKDENGSLVANTAGLPKVRGVAKYSEQTLLDKCIELANFLRNQFVFHLEDNGGNPERPDMHIMYNPSQTSDTEMHWALDEYSLSYFETIVPVGTVPVPLPTPSPDCTDYDSLVTLLTALDTAFEWHRRDVTGYSEDALGRLYGPFRYHAFGYLCGYFNGTFRVGSTPWIPAWDLNIAQPVVHLPDPNVGIPVDTPASDLRWAQLKNIAAYLDDLLVKFYLHVAAPGLHAFPSNAFVLDPANFLLEMIGEVKKESEGPIVTAAPLDLFNAVNYAVRAYNNHILAQDSFSTNTDMGMHTIFNQYLQISLPYAGNFLTTYSGTVGAEIALKADTVLAKLLIFYVRYLYQYMHCYDLTYSTQYVGTKSAWQTGYASTGGFMVMDSGGTNLFQGLPNGSQMVINKLSVAANAYFTGTKNFKFASFTTNENAPGKYRMFNSRADDGSNVTNNNKALIGNFMFHPYGFTLTPIAYTDLPYRYPDWLETDQALEDGHGYAPPIETLSPWITSLKDFVVSFDAHLKDPAIHYSVESVELEFRNPYTLPGVIYPAAQSLLQLAFPRDGLPTGKNDFFIPEAGNYAYAETYSHNYRIENGTEFRVESAPQYSEVINSILSFSKGSKVDSGVGTEIFHSILVEVQNPITIITAIKELNNDAGENYDLANIVLNFYRTASNSTTYVKLNGGEYVPEDGVFSDWSSDTTAARGSTPIVDETQILYTNGGVQSSEQPPVCKYMWEANGFTYYGGVQDGSQFLPYRVIQSKPLAPDWTYGANYVDLPDVVTGGGSARNENVVICERSVYRLEGSFGLTGEGAIVQQMISDKIGGISAASCVSTEIGLLFAGTDGFYHTDGYQMIKISMGFNATYVRATKTDLQKRAIKGTYDPIFRRVHWTAMSNEYASDNDIVFVFDLNFGAKPFSCFNTLNASSNSWNTSSICFHKDEMFIGDRHGYLFSTSGNVKTDPIIDTDVDQSLWQTTHVPWEYLSSALSFGTVAERKFISQMHHVGRNVGNVAMQIYTISNMNQNGNRVKELAPMRYVSNMVWGDPNFEWGNPECYWGVQGVNDQWRRMHNMTLRSDVFQIGVRPGRFTVYRSEDYSMLTATATSLAGVTTITFTNEAGRTAKVPSDCVGMFFTQDEDAYELEHEILSATVVGANTVITCVDTDAVIPAEMTGWEIKGYMKEQAFAMDALVIWYDYLGKLGSQYRGQSSSQGGGANGGSTT